MEYIDTPALVKKVKNGLLVLDELPMWYASRGYRDNPVDELKVFAQSRKLSIHLLYTAQNVQQVDASIRRLTATAFDNKRYGPFVVCSVLDPASGEKFGFRVLRVQKKVYDMYNTFEQIGTRDELLKVSERVPVELLRARALVARGCFTEHHVGGHPDQGGRVEWRPATAEAVMDGARVVEWWEDDWREVDTSELIWQALPVPALETQSQQAPKRRRVA
jgi:hypothetical protein